MSQGEQTTPAPIISLDPFATELCALAGRHVVRSGDVREMVRALLRTASGLLAMANTDEATEVRARIREVLDGV